MITMEDGPSTSVSFHHFNGPYDGAAVVVGLVGTAIFICMANKKIEPIWLDLNRHHIRIVQLHNT